MLCKDFLEIQHSCQYELFVGGFYCGICENIFVNFPKCKKFAGEKKVGLF